MYLHMTCSKKNHLVFKIDIVTKDNGDFYSIKVSESEVTNKVDINLQPSEQKLAEEKLVHSDTISITQSHVQYRHKILNLIKAVSELMKKNCKDTEGNKCLNQEKNEKHNNKIDKAAIKIRPELLVDDTFLKKSKDIWADMSHHCILCFEIDTYEILMNPNISKSLSVSRLHRMGFELWLDNYVDNKNSYSIVSGVDFDFVTLSKAHYWDISRDFTLFDNLKRDLNIPICLKEWPEDKLEELLSYCCSKYFSEYFYVQG